MNKKTLNKAQIQRLEAAFEVIENPIFSTIDNQGFMNFHKALFYFR